MEKIQIPDSVKNVLASEIKLTLDIEANAKRAIEESRLNLEKLINVVRLSLGVPDGYILRDLSEGFTMEAIDEK